MSENELKLDFFNKAEAELLSVTQWMEDCKKVHVMENMNRKQLDKMTMIDIAFQVKANINKMGMMYTSLFMLSKNYNRQFASFMRKDRLAKVLNNFEEMKNTMEDFNENEMASMSCEKENMPQDTTKGSSLFDKNLFAVIEHIDDYTETEIANGLTCLISQFCKVLSTNLTMCKNIMQEEQGNIDTHDALTAIYHKSLHEVWETVKDFASAFHEEDFKAEMSVAKLIADGDTTVLQDYYHRWTPQLFTRHAIAVHLLRERQQRINASSSTFSLFPDDPSREQNAIRVAKALDRIIVKTRKVNHSNNRQFATRCIVYLKEQLEYEGNISSFLAFLASHYQGKLCFPDLSAFSVDTKKMFQLEREKNTVDGILKLKQLNQMAYEQATRVKHLLNAPSSIRISA